MDTERVRTVLLTGSASGIGLATAELLVRQGCRVIGVNRRGGEIVADLATEAGCRAVVEQTAALTGGVLAAVIGCAGATSAAEPAQIVRCNYFGALAVLAGARAMLAASPAGRAVDVGSVGMIADVDEELVGACVDGDEERAVGRAEKIGGSITYTSCRRALGRWIRTHAARPEWAGEGIPLNLVAPGVVDTPPMHDAITDPGRKAWFEEHYPMPLGGFGTPEQIAPVLAFLASPANSMITGQIVFVDGGTEVVRRGDIW